MAKLPGGACQAAGRGRRAWTSDGYLAKLCFYETPFIATLRLQFAGDEVTLNSETNVGFTQTKQRELVGKKQ